MLAAVLPALPASGVQMVLWGTSAMITDGTGDGQVWIASANDSEWAPLYNFTDLSGTP
jgi:cobalamin biosynthesis Mg chelatase CobN